ncbi:MAG: hypothetical protein PVH61_41880 [Candidatus Aminicenantes bacterium]|jgi:hypothetical protein
MIIRREFWEEKAMEANSRGIAKPIVEEIHRTKGIPPKTIYRKLRDNGYISGRKTRSDAGYIDPNLKEHLILLASLYHRHIKKEANTPLELVVDLYSKSNPQVQLPSVSHIHTLFRKLGLSRRMARKPTPKLQIKCLYPNHVHFYDTSVCRYYISKKNNILYIPIPANYKNKPDRFVGKQVLVRHVIIDGCTGAFFVWYTTTQKTIDYAEFLFNAWKDKREYIFHGAPFKLVMDNDSGLRSHAFLRLLNYLEVDVPNVKPYAPWVKGYVEKMMHVWEIWFESRFLFVEKKVGSIDQINAWAYQYAIEFQKTRIHSRHKMTRFQAWQNGIQGYLRELPDYHTFQQLLHSDPVERKVTSQGVILYKGLKYKTKDSELFGKWVDIIEHPYLYRKNKAITLIWPTNKENPRNFLIPENKKYTLEPYQTDAYGYPLQIHPWGEYRGIKHTESQQNFKEVENAESPQVNPFDFSKSSNISYMPQTGEKIEPKNVVESKPIEFTKTLSKIHISELLRRPLSPDEVRYIDSQKKDTMTKEDIIELVNLFKVQSALTKEG